MKLLASVVLLSAVLVAVTLAAPEPEPHHGSPAVEVIVPSESRHGSDRDRYGSGYDRDRYGSGRDRDRDRDRDRYGGDRERYDRERYELGGSSFDRNRDREWGSRFGGEHRYHRCMRGCLREEGLRREYVCQRTCNFYETISNGGGHGSGGFGNGFRGDGYRP